MPVLFDIHQVTGSQHTSHLSTTPKGWLKDTLEQKFDWVEHTTILIIIQALVNYYRYKPSRIPFEWILSSLGVLIESLELTTRRNQSQSQIALRTRKKYLPSQFY
jgi:hypothetical protein